MNTIISKSIPYEQPITVFNRLCYFEKQIVFLDSAVQNDQLGRYSYICYSPCEIIRDFEQLKQHYQKFSCEMIAGVPPFQGGLVGYLSYDLGRSFEKLPNIAVDDMQFPNLEVGIFALVISFDYVLQKAWIVSTGFPEVDPKKRAIKAKQDLADCLHLLEKQLPKQRTKPISVLSKNDISSNFSTGAYQKAVLKTIDYIKAGDIFEANLSQRFSAQLPKGFDTCALYNRLHHKNPAPFAAFIRLSNVEILSSSPERFLKVIDHKVETRPIKGTMKRSQDPVLDRQYASQLMQSSKDHAENTMIVDLMRNDLSKVCKPHSIQVPQYCGIESYETVHHLVSVVTGELKETHNVIDLLAATFPGGSITGAPKIRAMEIIDELEPTRRGPYCGSVVCLGFNGYLESSILIRSYIIKDGVISFQGGGAIVLDSDPKREYEETLIKINRLKDVLINHDIAT